MGEHVQRYAPVATALTEAGHLVVGQDHRAHGASAKFDAELGQVGAAGWTEPVNDIHVLATRMRDEQPTLPLVLVAHSMGSFAAQQYLLDHSDEVTAVALTGTAALDLIEPGLDRDQPGTKAMFAAAREAANPDRLAAIRTDLPLCVAVGDQDPVNGQFAVLTPLVDRYRAAGLDVTFTVYPGARHEIFNETNRAEVIADLIAWLDRAVRAGAARSS